MVTLYTAISTRLVPFSPCGLLRRPGRAVLGVEARLLGVDERRLRRLLHVVRPRPHRAHPELGRAARANLALPRAAKVVQLPDDDVLVELLGRNFHDVHAVQ